MRLIKRKEVMQMLIATIIRTKIDGFKIEMTYCTDTPGLGDLL